VPGPRSRRAMRQPLAARVVISIATSLALVLVLAALGVESSSASTRSRLVLSLSPDRSSAVFLGSSTVEGEIYVFVMNSRTLAKVEFYLDDRWQTRPPTGIDMTPPFDLAGTADDGTARPYDTTKLVDGLHRLQAVLTWSNGYKSSRRADFTVKNSAVTPTAPPTTTAPTTTAPTTTAPTTTAPTTTLPTTTAPTTTAPTTTLPTTTAPTTTLPTAPTTSTTALPVPSGSWPSSPPARICGNAAVLSGSATAPAGATVVPAGDNSSLDLGQAGKTYWFAPGVHTLGTGEFDQIIPADGSTYLGGPGAILDGQGKNAYAFTQHGRNVTIKYLTIRNFVAPMNEGTVNHDSGVNWTMQYNTVVNNGGAGIFVGAGNVDSYYCL
jgi:hypothetical protein